MPEATAADVCDWLAGAPECSLVLTANRRLARLLKDHYDRRMTQGGATAWRTAGIHHWRDWVATKLEELASGGSGSTLSAAARQVLWESCARDVVGEDLAAVGALAGQAMAAFERLAQWRVPVHEVFASARSYDERAFAGMLDRYRARLRESNWQDPAEAAAGLAEELASGRHSLPSAVRLAGFDRRTPDIEALVAALRQAGCDARFQPPPRTDTRCCVQAYPDEAQELRAAGRWARNIVAANPERRPAIVVAELERDAESVLRYVREGFEPGWQFRQSDGAVECSYGRPLHAFPAIAVALRQLDWLSRGLRSADVSLLMRSPFTGPDDPGSRAGLERRLRSLPDQRWTPARLQRALADAAKAEKLDGWRTVIDVLADAATELLATRRPSEWAEWIDRLLTRTGWPGPKPLSSADYQLVNRWRELLQEFAGLDAVQRRSGFRQAVHRLHRLAADAVYQPDRPQGLLRVLGPLEAAGATFDHLWVARTDADRWPAAGRRHPLLARSLQEHYGLPDATPADTLDYAQSVLGRLAASAPEVRFSWSRGQGESLRFGSPLLGELDPLPAPSVADPGWHAAGLAADRDQLQQPPDPVPPAADSEALRGGASTIAMQRTEPFVAFARGRLDARDLDPFRPGLNALQRGNLTHYALQSLYAELPDRNEIESWTDRERRKRCRKAARLATNRFAAWTDPVLERILHFEQLRIERLALAVIESDAAREPFAVDAVEQRLELNRSGLRCKLRIDRVDRSADDRYIIIDYKTGKVPKLIRRGGETGDLQLAVYAAALDLPIAALSYLSVTPQVVAHSAVGSALAARPLDDDDWQQLLARLRAEVMQALTAIAKGDVRINPRVRDDYTWQLAVLSRVAEYRTDD